MNYNILVRSDYNISQYVHIYDKGWHPSDFDSAVFHLNTGNVKIPLNPRPKWPPYVVYFVLYEFRAICVLYKYIYICVCVTGHLYVDCVQIIMRCISNLRQWPLWNLGFIAYFYIAILDPPRPLLLRSDVLLGGISPYFPDTISTDVYIVSTQDHLPIWASPVSVPSYKRVVCLLYILCCMKLSFFNFPPPAFWN